LIFGFVVFNRGELYCLGYKKLKKKNNSNNNNNNNNNHNNVYGAAVIMTKVTAVHLMNAD